MKKWLLRRRIERLVREKTKPAWPPRRALILFDRPGLFSLSFTRQLAGITGIAPEEMHEIHAVKKPKEGIRCFTPQMIGWNGHIRDEEIRQLLEQPQTLVVDFMQHDALYKTLLSAAVPEAFHIGLGHHQPDWYDLHIVMDPFDEKTFLDSLRQLWPSLVV